MARRNKVDSEGIKLIFGVLICILIILSVPTIVGFKNKKASILRKIFIFLTNLPLTIICFGCIFDANWCLSYYNNYQDYFWCVGIAYWIVLTGIAAYEPDEYRKKIEDFSDVQQHSLSYSEKFKKLQERSKNYASRMNDFSVDDGIYTTNSSTLRISKFENVFDKHFWLSLNGYQFEKEVSKLFERLGYKVELTQCSRDGGVDIILEDKNNNKAYVQCKCNKSGTKVGVKTCRELFGTMMHNGVSHGFIVGISGFSNDAKEFTNNGCIKLVDLEDIIYMVNKSYKR